MNPLLGRWISADPLEVHSPKDSGDFNVYAYVSGATLKNIDPLGLEGEEFGPFLPLEELRRNIASGSAAAVVSYQDPDEYPAEAGAPDTARAVSGMIGDGKAGKHTWYGGIERQVLKAAAEGKTVRRIDSVGHTGSGLVSEESIWKLNAATARLLAPHMGVGSMVVVHGCGLNGGTAASHGLTRGELGSAGLGGMKEFLSALPSGATVYTHDILSGPGMPINFVENRLMEGENGGTQLVSHRLAGSDRVIGVIFDEDYVRNWAKNQNTDALKGYLKADTAYDQWAETHGDGSAAPNTTHMTDDVRGIVQAEVDSR